MKVTTKPFDGSVQAEGTVTTYVGETPVNLFGNEEIKGYALDSTDKKISLSLIHILCRKSHGLPVTCLCIPIRSCGTG